VGQWSVSVPGCREQTDVFSRSALGFLDVGSDTRPSTSDHASTDRFPRVLHMLNGASGQPRSFACSRTVVHRVLITPRLELSPLSRLLQPTDPPEQEQPSTYNIMPIIQRHTGVSQRETLPPSIQGRDGPCAETAVYAHLAMSSASGPVGSSEAARLH